jgi:DNA-binding MarR family transcriptional regulator
MSMSDRSVRGKAGPRRKAPSAPRGRTSIRAGAFLTATRPALLERGSDKRFRALVYDLLTIASRMDTVREHIARRMMLTGPQYSLLMSIAQQHAKGGVGVGALARLLHVSSAFVATETGRLAQAGLVEKRPNPEDGRGVILNVTRAGMAALEDNAAEICAINDAFFGELDRASFEAVSAAVAAIVAGSRKAMQRVRMNEFKADAAFQEAAE